MSISSEMAEGEGTPKKPQSQPRTLVFAPGSLIGDRYRVISLLGRGGMGEVYGADDLKLGQRVALKFLPADRLKSSSWREQFYAEVRMARQVSHPNVCRMYDVGESDGRLFLSMEFVDGEDLASLLRRIGRLPDDKAVEVAQQLCAGLAAAHAAGVLHRDLKPSNVMLDGKGRARITDFGLATALDHAAGEQPAGTPGYMAPELLKGASPTVQSDIYALGLVLYEVFTGKRAFEAQSLAELYRKQSDTNPTPPSNLVKNLDPAVERVMLRCLDRDPVQRPRSARSVAAALPGGDPLAAALAAGETPSPDMIAAAGPQGSLRPAYAWACLIASLILLVVTETLTYPRASDWGRSLMPKSPEVLTDHAQELAAKLGYADAVDHDAWISPDPGYADFVANNVGGKKWELAGKGKVWPSSLVFWFRQSPVWMTPTQPPNFVPGVTFRNPAYDVAGMVTMKLDMAGKLIYFRAVPSQLELDPANREPGWDALFAEAGLDKSKFVPGKAKWAPPDFYDSSADWDGYLGGDKDLPLHVSAAAWRGRPTYFQVVAPWNKPWQITHAFLVGDSSRIVTICMSVFVWTFIVVGGVFARRNFLRGRADVKGALSLFVFLTACNSLGVLFSDHFAPVELYIWSLFQSLAVPMLMSLLAWIGYMAVEPYVRRTWPHVMVSWQRLLNGRFRDPLIGRDLLLGIFAGFIFSLLASCLQRVQVQFSFGDGVLPSIGRIFDGLFVACLAPLLILALLSALTGLLRRKWLGLLVAGLLFAGISLGSSTGESVANVAQVVLVLFVLTRVGLLAAVGYFIGTAAINAPPLIFSRWYAGRALIALVPLVALLIYAFYISLGSQPMFGKVAEE
ncbi:MAG: serine/threonine-protein kinase [Candidatus Sulfotelmatobacter sp.]